MNKRKIICAVCVLIAAACCLGIISLYFSAGNYGKALFDYYLSQPLLLVLNSIPYIIICILMWIISNRVWIGFLFGACTCVAYSWTEYWKLLARNDPLYAEDLTLWKEALQMREGYAVLTKEMLLMGVLIVGGIGILAILFRGKMLGKRTRIISLIATIIVTIGMYMGVYSNAYIYDSFKVWGNLNQWLDVNMYISRGGIYPFLYSIQSAIPSSPKKYSEEKAVEYLQRYDYDNIAEDEKVNVICVMLEAFCDITEDTQYEFNGNPYEAFHKLKEESYSGKLVVNVFGGGTIDTERTVLTGFSELTSFRRPSWSYVRYFKEQGYILNGSHAGYEAFYNRMNVNRNLGFEGYYFIENYFKDLYGDIPPDYIFFPEITDICLKGMESGNKVFSFNVTYQNHGPYDGSRLYESFEKNEYVKKGTMDDEYYYVINNYLNGIADTCENMENMVNTFRGVDEPVVLLFFGDHRPWLGDQSAGYDVLGIDYASGTDESVYNQYETDYLIWANEAAQEVTGKSFKGLGEQISPCFLMNELFEQCGWEGPSYMKLTDDVRKELPVITSRDIYKENGELITGKEMSSESEKLLDMLKMTQFYLARDAKAEIPR